MVPFQTMFHARSRRDRPAGPASGADRAVEPRRVDLWAPFRYRLVVGVEQPSARRETFLFNYRRPAVGARRAGDEAQEVGPILVADEARAVRKPDCLQMAQQHPGGLTPRMQRMPDDVAGPDQHAVTTTLEDLLRHRLSIDLQSFVQ